MLLCGLALPGAAQSQKSDKDNKKYADITIRLTVIVHDPKGKPVNGAGVVMQQESVLYGRLAKHPFDVELHSDSNGMAQVQGFQPGDVLVQVIAKGYETYGQVFIMKKANETVHVKLNPPKRQVSIYH